MKRICLLLVLSVLFVQMAMSQNTFGVKAGLNVSNQLQYSSGSAPFPSHSNYNHNLAGYQLGVFYKRKLSKKWTIAGEANFSLIGSKKSYYTQDFTHDSVFNNIIKPLRDRIGYVELPFSLQYNVNRFYVGLGPSMAFRLFSKTSIDGAYTYYKPMDVAANLLAGFKLANKLDINMRYSYGFINTLNSDKTYGSNNTPITLKNRFANVSLLYSLF